MKSTTAAILRFMLRTAAVILPVAIPMLAWYVWADPYKVLRHYDSGDYFPDPAATPLRLGANKGIVTFGNLEKQKAAGHSYNAFIFGSSISCYYDAYTWAHLADSTEGHVRPYHMDSAWESPMSMADKVEYLDRNGYHIDYALFVLDPIVMNTDAGDGPALTAPPQLHKSWLETIKYHYTFFRTATNADFLKSWIPASVYGRPFVNGHNPVFETQPIIYDPVVNQENLPQWDSLITADPHAFYAAHPLPAPARTSSPSPVTLTGERLKAMRDIAAILRRHNTRCRIIIGPNRGRVTLNPADLHTLQGIFGHKAVCDFSSSLAGALDTDTLMYDKMHYRPVFATQLMQKAYAGNSPR